ncbi:RidA family protein [Pseudorhizobium pelagicum]|uniref:Endoribonuclease L-PSP n=1 Tax=Pseudorhizobium pelagicum TaxID=1509405 RepID=A0A922T9M1_9HYPH|nr:RidA family protein [Pseudorhizobium pelagicum]KEQ02913.1 endoribonuclease L-PSP [Pseudorhizobium pelagicum]KEQ03070.1 endoribonuclease L-PSP [Pseudorhizobium pelagicum]
MYREIVIPAQMQKIVDRAGDVPAVRVGDTIYLAGQVGRGEDLQVIEDPAEQFQAMWENLNIALAAAGCVFEDVVGMTTYHVDMPRHMELFRLIKDQMFPRANCAWTCVGVTELAHPGLLAGLKCIAVRSG